MKLGLWMDFLIDDEDKLWFIDGQNTGIFFVDKKSGNVKFVSKLPGGYDDTIRAYNGGIKYKNKLVFCPFHARTVLVYQIDEEKSEEILLDPSVAGKVQFANTMVVDNYLIMIGSYREHILVKFNLEDYSYKVFNYEKYLGKDNTLYRDMVCVDGEIFAVSKKDGIILSFDVKKETFAAINKSISTGFGTIAYDGKNIWLSGEKGVYKISNIYDDDAEQIYYPDSLGMYAVADKQKKYVIGFDKQISKWGQPFFKSFVRKNKLWLIPAEMNEALIIDINSGLAQGISLSQLNIVDLEASNVSLLEYLCAIQTKDGLFVYSTKERVIYRVDIDEDRVFRNRLSLSMEYCDWKDFFDKRIKTQYEETNSLEINDFLCVMMESGNNSKEICQRSIGSELWEAVKG